MTQQSAISYARNAGFAVWQDEYNNWIADRDDCDLAYYILTDSGDKPSGWYWRRISS